MEEHGVGTGPWKMDSSSMARKDIPGGWNGTWKGLEFGKSEGVKSVCRRLCACSSGEQNFNMPDRKHLTIDTLDQESSLYRGHLVISFKKNNQIIYLAVPGLSRGKLDLVTWPEIEPSTPALGAWSLRHWTTREVSRDFLLEGVEIIFQRVAY